MREVVGNRSLSSRGMEEGAERRGPKLQMFAANSGHIVNIIHALNF